MSDDNEKKPETTDNSGIKVKVTPDGVVDARMPNGRFAKGSNWGLARRSYRKIKSKEYRKLLWEALTPDRFQAMVASMIVDAVKGHDNRARELLLRYSIGQPESFLDEEDKASSSTLLEALGRHQLQMVMAPHLAGPAPEIPDDIDVIDMVIDVDSDDAD